MLLQGETWVGRVFCVLAFTPALPPLLAATPAPWPVVVAAGPVPGLPRDGLDVWGLTDGPGVNVRGLEACAAPGEERGI